MGGGITQTLAGAPLTPSPHKIQGIGAGFAPENLDLAMVGRVETVSDEEAVKMARRLAKEEGILSGISGGAAAAVALRLARDDAFAGKTIVTGRVSGNFPNSPVELRYAFTLAGGKIARLEIA
ncbi:MAG: hypothetical protein DME10_06420 [Candidatus Rokuibacteriota bacterium]|nr:MAG: hypothetical protein DME10_06420 [Candidatus Rokubacteria bacterium]